MIEKACADYTASPSRLFSTLFVVSCDFWYSLRYLLLTNIEKRVIVPMLTAIQAIWTPAFRPTGKEREKIVNITGSRRKWVNQGLTLVFGPKRDRQHCPREVVERHEVAISEDSWE